MTIAITYAPLPAQSENGGEGVRVYCDVGSSSIIPNAIKMKV
jgi:hypothetical protein